MNSNRSIDELLSLFRINNVSDLGPDIIEKFFDDISVQEVTKLCRVNRTFNRVCEKETMWKRKVMYDYGVTKKYLDSWKNTAKFLYKSNMINLRQQWIDGRTYGELLEESMRSNDDDFFKKLLKEYRGYSHSAVVYSDFVNDLKTAEQDLAERYPDHQNHVHTDYFLEEYLYDIGVVSHNEEDSLQKDLKIVTREFSVISHAFGEIHGFNKELDDDYGLACQALRTRELNEPIYDKSQMRKIRLLSDPILYVMTYSSMNLNDLNRITMFNEPT